jgi:hypothetical protein
MSLTAVLAACGGESPSARVSTLPLSVSAHTAPGGFSIEPDIADHSCHGGHGAKIATHAWSEPVDAAGTLADGSTLAAFSQIYPGKDFATLDSVTSRCLRASKFGDAGVAKIRISPHLVPHPTEPGPNHLWINSVSSRRGGGALVAGTYRGRWVVGAVSPHGQLDRTFGTHGWTALPLRGEVTAILQERSGRIMVGGDNDGAGCCTVNHAAALTSDGHLDRAFGEGGRVTLPTGEDSGVDSLAREPNGDILAEVGYGNMGCFGLALAMLTPSGRPVSHFSTRLNQFWRRLDFGAFVGDVYIDRGGFTLVGTGQRSCYEDGPKSGAKPIGVLARFRTDGGTARPTVHFPSKLFGAVDAFPDGADTLMAQAPYADDARLTLRLLRPDGSANKNFGKDGRVLISTPWQGHDATLETSVLLSRTSRKSLTIVATESERKQLQMTRIHF